MTHLIGRRGSVGGLTIRRSTDWLHTPAARDNMPDLMLRSTGTETRADGPGGFEGWACIFGVEDSYGTTFEPGCFTEAGLDDTAYPLLWMHSGFMPIGTFVAEERDEGLWIAGDYDPTPDGQTARARALSGSAPELSVGFVWLDDGGEDEPDLITKARLVETSQITLRMAAVPGAGLQAARGDDNALAEQIAAEADRDLEAARVARERATAALGLALVL